MIIMNTQSLNSLFLLALLVALSSCSDSASVMQNNNPAKDMVFFDEYTTLSNKLYSIGINGVGQAIIPNGGSIYSSPVGNKLLCTKYIDSQRKEIGVYLMDVFGNNEKLLFSRQKLDYAILSPDGRYVCYHIPGVTLKYGDIFLYSIEEGTQTEITDSLIPGSVDA